MVLRARLLVLILVLALCSTAIAEGQDIVPGLTCANGERR